MHNLSFWLLRSLLWLLSFLSFKTLYNLAKALAPLCYLLIAKYRKRALSNLQLAKDLQLSRDSIIDISKKSLFHLLLTALEYGKLRRVSSLKDFVKSPQDSSADETLDHHQGVVFFCGHQSNWELLFLDATSRHAGVCIGKPIKNKKLYEFILSIREKFKGKVIVPKEAYKGCLKALKDGRLVGVVGDQGLPESSFIYSCFGRKAHMTTLPALLSTRAKAPLYVATIVRGFGSYTIEYTGPVDVSLSQNPIEDLTLKSLLILDEKIKAHPEQWMWQHNRWKIPYKPFIPKKFKHDAIACILSNTLKDPLSQIELLKEVYEGAYVIVFKHEDIQDLISADEIYIYKQPSDCFIQHFGPKLLIDTVGIKGIKAHFEKQALFTYLHTPCIKTLIDNWKENAH
jgi:KDO2-lipid IV(A) lauroyltransferase